MPQFHDPNFLPVLPLKMSCLGTKTESQRGLAPENLKCPPRVSDTSDVNWKTNYPFCTVFRLDCSLLNLLYFDLLVYSALVLTSCSLCEHSVELPTSLFPRRERDRKWISMYPYEDNLNRGWGQPSGCMPSGGLVCPYLILLPEVYQIWAFSYGFCRGWGECGGCGHNMEPAFSIVDFNFADTALHSIVAWCDTFIFCFYCFSKWPWIGEGQARWG